MARLGPRPAAQGAVSPSAGEPGTPLLALSRASSSKYLLGRSPQRNSIQSKYLELLARLRFPHLRSIVFDQMLPRIAHYWPREQVLQLMGQAGLADIQVASVNQM